MAPSLIGRIAHEKPNQTSTAHETRRIAAAAGPARVPGTAIALQSRMIRSSQGRSAQSAGDRLVQVVRIAPVGS